jgi:hypothetical protein
MARSRASSFDELLTAVDVEGCAGDRGVGHEVDRQCGNIGRADDPSDRQRGTELLAARVQLVTEKLCGQRCVDKSGGDEVHPDWRELEREVFVRAGPAAVSAERK